jgi:cytochrome b subunit of formate dehydrogenase
VKTLQDTRRRIALTIWWVAVLGCFSAGRAQEQAACSDCHEQAAKLAQSAHAQVGCATCHPKHESYPHPENIAKPACGQCHQAQAGDFARSVHAQAARSGNAGAPDCAVCHGAAHEAAPARSAGFRASVPETCGMCHSDIAGQFQTSVHGRALAKGVVQAPVCTDCHGEHSIQKPSSSASLVNPNHIRETCGQCHGNVRLTRSFGLPADRVVSFDASFHGLAAAAGSQSVANCASCHGVHNILPSSDPRSTIHPGNLAATCGRCHTGVAATRLALGPVHVWAGRTEPAAVRYVRQIYLVLIPAVIGLMLLFNLGDWLRKLKRLRLDGLEYPETTPHGPIRMYRFERVLHAMLAISFIVLAWTGFQLKYPDQWWARPVLAWEAQWSVRGIVHRSAAVVFLVTALLHALSLAWNPGLRAHWKLLWPRYTDVLDGLRAFAYNLGFSNRKPGLPPYSFVEKAEYWAVVWGGVVMGVSGLLLWANNLALRWLPKEVLDCATALHFYEAVLACLAIVVWHLYGVIFDPEVYPVDTAWLTGRSVRRHAAGEAPELEPAARW